MASTEQTKIPIIDLCNHDLKPGTSTWLTTSKQVCNALEGAGCFQVQFNKPTLQLHREVFLMIEKLYDLPPDTRRKSPSEKSFRGYVSASPVHESIGVDNPTILEDVEKFTKVMWPDHGNASFCETANAISKIMEEINQMVLKMVFQYYGVEDKNYEAQIKSTEYALRLSKYREHEQKSEDMALRMHTDKTFSTIVHQGEVKGLQVQTKDGDWVDYDPPSHTSFLYLAGQAFKVWSNARIKPCVHRVFTSGEKVRYAVALFGFNNGVISTPDELVDETHPLRYKPMDHPEYLRQVVINAARLIDYPVEAYCGI